MPFILQILRCYLHRCLWMELQFVSQFPPYVCLSLILPARAAVVVVVHSKALTIQIL